jgi:hypothetical protein
MLTYITRYIILYKVEVTLYKIIITKWALDSYLELKHKRTFLDEEFKSTLKPDVLLLRHYPDSPKFKNAKFWGNAKIQGGMPISNGFKMKWHHIGSGQIQLRLSVAMLSSQAILCQAYVKHNEKEDKLQIAIFSLYMDYILKNKHKEVGKI